MIDISVSFVVYTLQLEAESESIRFCSGVEALFAPDVIFFFGVKARHLDLQCGEHPPEMLNVFSKCVLSQVWGLRGVVSIVV